MTDETENYMMNKDLVWALVHDINDKLDDAKTSTAQAGYMLGILRMCECIIVGGDVLPSLDTDVVSSRK